MSIENKVRQIEHLFDSLEIEITKFKSDSNLYCISGCGKCCTTPHIDASPLEFLPWAFHLFLNHKATETLHELKNNNTSFCYIYKPLNSINNNNGSCSSYKYRGLICRLFGFAASKDQFGKLRLATCKIIKETQTENFKNTSEAINKKLYVPVFSDYYMKLAQIDFKMATTMLPINLALQKAIEEVLHYYAYRPFPNELKEIV